ncbi:SGNH/GDSL hydrolase family protein [Lacticaseibacillus jixianensis]|uniref:SGNH/GDSL hydrolase family protein n=1 Tax=Lacticaseibacillus jixianensis TaxID=2486012 RepID=A0ABW4B9Z8_9LACO|nr:SGNH/GDSL hydrolase family protein [Lacticaseibacillus jixianensis]
MRRIFGGLMIVLISIIMIVGLAKIGNSREQAQLEAQSASYARTDRSSSSAVSSSSSSEKKASAKPKPGQGKTLSLAVMGDDMAAGHFTSTEKSAYQYLVAADIQKSLGFKVTLTGTWRSGATIGTSGLPNISSVTTNKPDVVILQYGNNEQTAAGSTAGLYHDNLMKAVQTLRAQLPKVKVIIITPWTQNAAFQRSVTQVGSSTGVSVVDISQISTDNVNHASANTSSWAGKVSGDWPNDQGNAKIAAAVEQVIAKAY